MDNYIYHIKRPPLNVTIFITHMGSLHNGCYTNDVASVQIESKIVINFLLINLRYSTVQCDLLL